MSGPNGTPAPAVRWPPLCSTDPTSFLSLCWTGSSSGLCGQGRANVGDGDVPTCQCDSTEGYRGVHVTGWSLVQVSGRAVFTPLEVTCYFTVVCFIFSIYFGAEEDELQRTMQTHNFQLHKVINFKLKRELISFYLRPQTYQSPLILHLLQLLIQKP